ncbi:hypothetical protein ACFYOK_10815 [Microbispora bryophytorum]|uniref:hypothetical protein n=1 Tax=Microbispora bryophytorum TaxID=1460882 RepID=UPI0033CEB002
MTNLTAFSFGGGRQSVAALVLQAQGKLGQDFDHWLFSNVGDDSEHPATLRYVEEHAIPFAERHGIDLRVLHKVGRDGQVKTLYGQVTRPESRSIDIPVRMEGSAAPGNRSCTGDFKIKVIGKWLKDHGATPDNPAIVGVGISLDEIERANTRRALPHERVVYPLLDLKLRLTDCIGIIRAAGLPLPPKSSCWFCPFHRLDAWTDMGGTMDGVEVELKQEYKELTVDQLVDIPARRLTKRELTFKTKLAEPTLERLNWALNSATGGVTTGAGFESLEPDDSSAATQPTYSAVMLDGYAPGGLRRRIILRKVLSVEGVKTSYKKEDQTVFEVSLATHYVSPSITPFKVVDEVDA